MSFCFLNRIIGIISPLAAQVNSSEAVDGHIGTLIHRHETHHLLLRYIGAESDLPADPVGTLLGNGLLRQLIAELDLKIGAVQATLSVQPGNVKLSLLLGHFLLNECGRGKDETQLVDPIQLLFQLLIGIDGETGGGDREFASLFDGGLQIRAHGLIDIVQYLHSGLLQRSEDVVSDFLLLRYFCENPIYLPLLILASPGFSASFGMAQLRPRRSAPEMRPEAQRVWIRRELIPHFSAASAIDM